MTGDVVPPGSARLVVFDFDHTLYNGDSGGDMVQWLLRRNAARACAAIVASLVLLPMIAFLPTRRRGISGYLWIGTFGLRDYHDLNALIRQFVTARAAPLRAALLPIGIDVLEQHLAAGDRVVVATGAPPELARSILAFVAHEQVPVVGSHEAPRWGGLVTIDHCHARNKLHCLVRAGYGGPIAVAYSDSSADLPLLIAAERPVVVNPKASRVAMFRRVLPAGTSILNWGCPGRAGDPPVLAASATATGASG